MAEEIWARCSTTTRARVGEVCWLPLPLPCSLSFWCIHIAQCVLHLYCTQTKWEGRTDEKFWNISKELSTNLFLFFGGFGDFFKQYIPILLVNNVNMPRSGTVPISVSSRSLVQDLHWYSPQREFGGHWGTMLHILLSSKLLHRNPG